MSNDDALIEFNRGIGRSAITNGRLFFFPYRDKRSHEARRFVDLLLHYLRETKGQRPELCRQLAILETRREVLESQDDPDDDLLLRTAAMVLQTQRALGLIGKNNGRRAADDRAQAERDMREAGLL